MWYARGRKQLTVFGAEITQHRGLAGGSRVATTYVVLVSSVVEHSPRFTMVPLLLLLLLPLLPPLQLLLPLPATSTTTTTAATSTGSGT